MEDNSNWNGTIRIRKEVTDLFPGIVVAYLTGNIKNIEGDPVLWELIEARSKVINGSMDEEAIRNVEGIRLGKRAYRQLGKDPDRYRLSAEALMRRAAKGKDLYSISNAVDALNLVSLTTGITIGGFDAQMVTGDVELGIGLPGEEFIAIGRGPLNVANLPVYRDRLGAIGNPTSDSERTMITLSTTQILMLITGFYGEQGIHPAIEELESLLVKFCKCTQLKTGIIGNI
jgi:DNA/RNA-binding domain of Phe-tRNA-synthetase-like protein